MTQDPPELAIRSWADKYRGQWLVVRVADRRVLTSGTLDHCIEWVKQNAHTEAAHARGSALSEQVRW